MSAHLQVQHLPFIEALLARMRLLRWREAWLRAGCEPPRVLRRDDSVLIRRASASDIIVVCAAYARACDRRRPAPRRRPRSC